MRRKLLSSSELSVDRLDSQVDGVQKHIVDESHVYSKDTNIYQNIYQSTSTRFVAFWHLMLVWKSSVLKLIWHDLLVFLILYFALSVVYRVWLVDYPEAKELFEIICVYASRFRNLIPITFLTGFYVSQVVTRYWDQFFTLPYPDRVAFKLVSFVPGTDPFSRKLRRAVMRYTNLSIILTFRLVSPGVKERFPTLKSLEDAKLLLPSETARLSDVEGRTPHEITWAPLLWAQSLIQWARSTKKIEMEGPVFASLIGSFEYIESCNRKLLSYGWVNFPLAYTQVATISVFAYFFTSLFGAQFLVLDEQNNDHTTFPSWNISFSSVEPFKWHTPDLYIPVFTILEFIAYMGWIKVAEALLNPFGSDDEDLDINYLLDRNFQVCYMIVDQAEMKIEEVPNDPVLDSGEAAPAELPYPDAPARKRSLVSLTTPKLRRRSTKRDSKRESMRSRFEPPSPRPGEGGLATVTEGVAMRTGAVRPDVVKADVVVTVDAPDFCKSAIDAAGSDDANANYVTRF